MKLFVFSVLVLVLLARASAATVEQANVFQRWDGGYCASIPLNVKDSRIILDFTSVVTIPSGSLSRVISGEWLKLESTKWIVTPSSWSLPLNQQSGHLAMFCVERVIDASRNPTHETDITYDNSVGAPSTIETEAPIVTVDPATLVLCGGGIVGNGQCWNRSLCCSNYGYCGTQAEHCAFGSCTGSPCWSPPPLKPTLPPPADICPLGENCFTNPFLCGECSPVGATGCLNSSHVALTFDDGPHPTYTDMILDILAENDIKATFFITGTFAEKAGIVLQREYAEGHLVASHGYEHTGPPNGIPLMDGRPLEDQKSLLEKNQDLFKSTVGVKPQIFRSPFLGCTTPQCLNLVHSYGLKHVGRNVDTNDWKVSDTDPDPGPAFVANMLEHISLSPVPASDGYIVLLHDIHEKTTRGLQAVIDHFRGLNKTFVRVDECLGYNPKPYQL